MFKKYFLCLALMGAVLNNVCFAQEREIAITIDDLPFVGTAGNDSVKLQREHDRFMSIMQALVDNKVPATGFVIAGTIEKGQWQLLEDFHNAGFVLGNHTYTHANLARTSAEKYIADVDRADKVLAPLMTETKYFRYPYLAEGAGHKRRQVQNYLASNQYVIAPVTIDSKDFLFNKQFYRIPYRLREQNLNKIKERYLSYIWKQTLKAENEAKNIKDRPVRQILLLHANLLNSYCLGDVLEMYKKNGYRFISLAEALEQPAPVIHNAPSDTPQEQQEQFELIFQDNVVNSLFKHYKS